MGATDMRRQIETIVQRFAEIAPSGSARLVPDPRTLPRSERAAAQTTATPTERSLLARMFGRD